MPKIKSPKIAFIQVSGFLDSLWRYYPPIGLTSVATYASHYNHVPKKNFLIVDSNLKSYLRMVKSFKPDIVGLSCFSNNYLQTVEICQILKKNLPNTLFIIGGVHISLFPKTLHPSFDLAVMKEGEATFSEIISVWRKHRRPQAKHFHELKGIAYHGQDKVVINPERPLIMPLDQIPPIDWKLIPKIFFRRELIRDYHHDIWQSHKAFPLFTSRGCPYHCTFCARSALWKMVRLFSESRVVDEIENLYLNYGITAIQIWDDLFVFSKERLEKIIKLLDDRNLLGKIYFYWVFARSDIFTPEIAQTLKKLNVVSVAFGMESGSPKILKYLKKNTSTVPNNYAAADTCEAYNIGFVSCQMLGAPTETGSDMRKSLRFTKYIYGKNTLEAIDLARATPLPGTELYDYAIQKKLLPKNYEYTPKFLSLNNNDNDTPILITEKKQVEAYRFYWKKIKAFEGRVINRKKKQRGYTLAHLNITFYNRLNDLLYIPRFALNLIKTGSYQQLFDYLLHPVDKKL